MDEMCVSDWGHVLHYSVNLTSLNFLKGVSPPPPLEPHLVNLVVLITLLVKHLTNPLWDAGSNSGTTFMFDTHLFHFHINLDSNTCFKYSFQEEGKIVHNKAHNFINNTYNLQTILIVSCKTKFSKHKREQKFDLIYLKFPY